MLALASPDVSGRSRVATGIRTPAHLPSRRPDWLHAFESRCKCGLGGTHMFAPPGHILYDSHYEVREVYWDGYQAIYSQWYKYNTQYPIFRSGGWYGDDDATR